MTAPKQHILLDAVVPETLDNLRLDQAAAKLFPDYSRSLLKKWIKNTSLLVDNKSLKPKEKVYQGQKIEINALLEDQQDWQAQPIELNIIYEDESIILLNKAVGQVVHPAAGHLDNTLVNALLHHDPTLNQLPRAGIVHRLDKKTSGIMVVAKTLAAHKYLVDAIQKREVKREYEAIINGVMISGGIVDAPIDRNPHVRTKMAVIETGKTAVTHYRIIKKFRRHTHLHVELETGRTHQIRVHMAHIRYPIVGDPQYGRKPVHDAKTNKALINYLTDFHRQALHARKLTLQHPETNEIVSFEAPLPEDMDILLKLLEEDST